MQYAVGVLILIFFLSLGAVINSDPDTTRTSSVTPVTSVSEPDEALVDTSISNSEVRSNISESRSSVETSEPIELVDLSTPQVSTLSAENIEYSSAVVRGEVDMHSHTNGLVFVVYGYNKKSVVDLSQKYKKFEEIPKFDNDKVRTKIVDSRPKGSELHKLRLSRLIQNTEYFFQICAQHILDSTVITCGEVKSFTTNIRDPRSNIFREPQISSSKAINITGYTAELEGSVSMNDGLSGIAFFVYGEDENLIRSVDKENQRYSDVKEDDEFLQKTRLATNLLGRSEFTRQIDDLDLGTEYYFRICVEYDGEKNGLKCSSARSFTTDRRDLDDIPSVLTGLSAVSGNTVKLSGSVNMLDFSDGLVFFVYGTDFDSINEVHEKDSFSRIRQSSDALQRVSVDNDHDGKNDFTRSFSDLKQNTSYYYRLCVEYENEDENGRDKPFLSCGAVKVFAIQ